jgi:hypothetical protein
MKNNELAYQRKSEIIKKLNAEKEKIKAEAESLAKKVKLVKK